MKEKVTILTRVKDLITTSVQVTGDGCGILRIGTNMRRAVEEFAYYNQEQDRWHTLMPKSTPLEVVAIFSKHGIAWALVIVTDGDTLIHTMIAKSKKFPHDFMGDDIRDSAYKAARQHYLHNTALKEWEVGCEDEEVAAFLNAGAILVRKLFTPLLLRNSSSDRERKDRIDKSLDDLLGLGAEQEQKS